jgi:uncharacterized protein YeaO (DUF488 family)
MSTQQIAKTLSGEAEPLGEEHWARSYRQLTDVATRYSDEIKRLDKENARLRDENEKLKLSLLFYAHDRFAN